MIGGLLMLQEIMLLLQFTNLGLGLVSIQDTDSKLTLKRRGALF